MGDLQRFGGGAVARFMARTLELAAWSEAHRELAESWDEAFQEGERRDQEADRRRWEADLLREAPDRLHAMGIRRDVAESVASEARRPEAERRYWLTEAMLHTRTFVANPAASTLLLLGPAGVGKTCAAAWCLFVGARSREYEAWQVRLDEGRGALITAPELARLPRFDDDRFDRLLRLMWLVVDDLGTEVRTDHATERLTELFERRHGNRLRTIYTSNFGAREFEKTYGDRIWSRLHEHAMVCGAGSEDLRRQTRAAL